MRGLADLQPGDRLGDYVIEGVLGHGGMGRVYKAYHPRLKRRAAIKVMGAVKDRDAVRRFEREAQAVGALRHPHILSVFDFGELAGEPYMVLEYMAGGSLAERTGELPMEPGEVIRILRPVAAALDHAHRHGVIHRDVKPGNVFLDGDQRPVLGDFGLSKGGRMDSLTDTGAVAGTPAYLSPEQARGLPLTGATDIYSLAVMAFLLLTGELPFKGGSDALTVLYQHVNEPPPPPSGVRPGLPPAVDDIVLRGLAKDPRDRWPTASAMIEALAAALGAAPPVLEATARTGRRWTPPPARAVGPAIAGVALLVLLGAGGFAVRGQIASVLPGAGAAAPSEAPQPPVPPAPGHITVDGSGALALSGSVHVRGDGLDPNRPARIYLDQGGVRAAIEEDALVRIGPDGSFDEVGTVNPDLRPGPAKLRACNLKPDGSVDTATCVSASVTLVPGS